MVKTLLVSLATFGLGVSMAAAQTTGGLRRKRSLEMAEWTSQISCSCTDFTQCNSLSSNLSDDDSHDLERFSVVASILAATEPSNRHTGFNRS
jgi:hypothetical protein